MIGAQHAPQQLTLANPIEWFVGGGAGGKPVEGGVFVAVERVRRVGRRPRGPGLWCDKAPIEGCRQLWLGTGKQALVRVANA